MKTAIIYATKHGATRKIADIIRKKWEKDPPDVISLRKNIHPDLSHYDKIILGTSVYAGKPLKVMTKFCTSYSDVLEGKIIGLFISGMEIDPEKQMILLQNAYPKVLQEKAKAVSMLGGEYVFERMNIIEKAIIKKVAGVTNSISNLNMKEIDIFVKKLSE